MVRKKFFILIFIFSFCLLLTAPVFSATVNLWEIFPKNSQGENGVYANAYNLDTSIFRNLTYITDYVFGTPENSNWNIPYIASPRDNYPWIITHPLGTEFNGQEQTILLLSSPYGQVLIDRIQGQINPNDGGYVSFSIVGSNLTGQSIELYQQNIGNNNVSFDIGPFSQSFQFISFHVDPLGYSHYDTTYYNATIEFRPVPIPSTFLLFISSLTILPIIRKKIFSK